MLKYHTSLLFELGSLIIGAVLLLKLVWLLELLSLLELLELLSLDLY